MNSDNEIMTVVLYEGRYQAAERYARMLAEKRDVDLVPARDAKLTALRGYRTIILIGAVYNGEILGLDTLKRYYGKLKQQDSQNEVTQQYDKVHRYAVLAVGAAPEEVAVNGYAAQLPGKLAEIPLFYARGVWDEKALNSGDALRISLIRRALTAKQAPAKNMVPAWLADLMQDQEAKDFINEAYLDPLLDVIDGRF